jgi:hypothetical protein
MNMQRALAVGVIVGVLQAASQTEPIIIEAPDAPVRLQSARLLNPGQTPLVLLVDAQNQTPEAAEQFMVTVYVFNAAGVRKGSQTAPGRRTLDPKSSKFSAMVLDGFAIEPTDRLFVGVQQVQWAASGEWWRGQLLPIAEARVKTLQPPPK